MSVNDAPNGVPSDVPSTAPDNPGGMPPYQGQPYGQAPPGQPYPGQPYPGQPYPGQPYSGGAYPGGTYGAVPSYAKAPPTYMYWAMTASVVGLLFSTFLGLPAGITATRYARKVRPAWDGGHPTESVRLSKRALTWAIVATVLDVLGLILFIALVSHPAANTG
jgi:hypothetical protein